MKTLMARWLGSVTLTFDLDCKAALLFSLLGLTLSLAVLV